MGVENEAAADSKLNESPVYTLSYSNTFSFVGYGHQFYY